MGLSWGVTDRPRRRPPYEAADVPCRDQAPRFDSDQPREVRAAAKAVCASCPLRASCLEWALRNGMCGVWGGTDDAERDVIRRRRGITPIRLAATGWNGMQPHRLTS